MEESGRRRPLNHIHIRAHAGTYADRHSHTNTHTNTNLVLSLLGFLAFFRLSLGDSLLGDVFNKDLLWPVMDLFGSSAEE